MNVFVSLALLFAVAQVNCADVSPASSVMRYHVSRVFEAPDAIVETTEFPQYTVAGQSYRNISYDIYASLDTKKHRLTTLTIPKPAEESADISELVKSEGCIDVVFKKPEELKSTDKISEKSLVIIIADVTDPTVFKSENAASLISSKSTVAFLKRFDAVKEETRKNLIASRIPFIENLELTPESFLKEKVSKKFFAFKMVFAPFKNGSSTIKTDKAEEPLINLVDVVLLEADAKLTEVCKYKSSAVALTQKLTTDTYPILPSAHRPEIVDKNSEKMLRFAGQTGTNIVAPLRFSEGKDDVSTIEIEKTSLVPCVRLTIPAGDQDSFKVTKEDLEKNINDLPSKSLPKNALVLIDTEFGYKQWSNDKYITSFPGLAKDAVEYLVEKHSISAIAIDSMAFDSAQRVKESEFKTHAYLAEKNIPAILNVKFNPLFKKNDVDAVCVLTYLRVKGGLSAPAAIFALPGYNKPVEEKKALPVKSLDEVDDTTGMKRDPPSTIETDRWQFGAIIKTSADINIRPISKQISPSADDSSTDKKTMTANDLALTVDPSKNKVTTFTQPSTKPIVDAEGCLETRFIKSSDITAIKAKLNEIKAERTIVILTGTELASLTDEVYKVMSEKKVIVAFFADAKLPTDVRDKLIKSDVSFFENLARPDGFNVEKVAEDKTYYGFKLVFAPLKDETSLPSSLKATPPRKVNLADLVVFDTLATDVVKRCSNKASSITIMNQPFGPSESIPVFTGSARPQLVGEKLNFSDHYSSHIDAPYHFDNARFDTAKLPGALNHPECVKMIIPAQGASYSISRKDIEDWEKTIKKTIPARSIVLIDTAFARNNWKNVANYEKDYPGLSLEAAKFLVEERKVKAIGIDSMSLDNFTLASKNKFPTHYYLATKEVVAILNIGKQIDYLPPHGGMCVMSYLRIEKGTGAHVALFGLPDAPTSQVQEDPSKKTQSTDKKSGKSDASTVMPSAVVMAALSLFAARLF